MRAADEERVEGAGVQLGHGVADGEVQELGA